MFLQTWERMSPIKTISQKCPFDAWSVIRSVGRCCFGSSPSLFFPNVLGVRAFETKIDNDDEFDVSPKAAAAAVGGGCQGGVPRVGGGRCAVGTESSIREQRGHRLARLILFHHKKMPNSTRPMKMETLIIFCGQYNDCDETIRGFDAAAHADWGRYYDPQNIFCGQYDCYKILELDYESFGYQQAAPTPKEIWQRWPGPGIQKIRTIRMPNPGFENYPGVRDFSRRATKNGL
jgi:hypothetical protein